MTTALAAEVALGPPSLVSETKLYEFTSTKLINYSTILLIALRLTNLLLFPENVCKFPPGYKEVDHKRRNCA